MQADKVDIDTKTGNSIYHGHVVFQRGSTRIQADKVILSGTRQGDIRMATASGNRAHYQTRPAKDKAFLDAFAKQIRYDAKLQKVTLRGDALVRQGKNNLKAPIIIYHLNSGRLETKAINNKRTVIRLFPEGKPAFGDDL